MMEKEKGTPMTRGQLILSLLWTYAEAVIAIILLVTMVVLVVGTFWYIHSSNAHYLETCQAMGYSLTECEWMRMN